MGLVETAAKRHGRSSLALKGGGALAAQTWGFRLSGRVICKSCDANRTIVCTRDRVYRVLECGGCGGDGRERQSHHMLDVSERGPRVCGQNTGAVVRILANETIVRFCVGHSISTGFDWGASIRVEFAQTVEIPPFPTRFVKNAWSRVEAPRGGARRTTVSLQDRPRAA